MLNVDEFIAQVNQNPKDKRRTENRKKKILMIDGWLNHRLDVEINELGRDPKDVFSDEDKSSYRILFVEEHTYSGVLNITAFDKNKKLILDVAEYKQKTESVDLSEFIKTIRSIQYDDLKIEKVSYAYSTLDEVLSAINFISNSNQKYLTEKAILILAWNGMRVNEIVNAKVSDLNGANHTIKCGERIISLTSQNFRFLKQYIEARYCENREGDKLVILRKSPYICRNSRSEQLTVTRASKMVLLLSEDLMECGYPPINAIGMLKCGKFYRYYTTGKMPKFAQNASGYNMKYAFKKEYNSWLNIYKSKQGE